MIATAVTTEKMSFILSVASKQVEPFTVEHISDFVEKVKNSLHYDFFIIDVDFFINDNPDKIADELYRLSIVNPARIIVIAQGKVHGDKMLSKMAELGLNHFVLSLQPATMLKELEGCLAGNPMVNVDDLIISDKPSKAGLSRLLPSINKPKKRLIKVGIAGILSRIGTTTQAFRLCKSLKNACYVERNNNAHISILKDVFALAVEKADGLIHYSDIDMFFNGIKPQSSDYEYQIIDYGTDWQAATDNDFTVIVAGTKAWELAELAIKLNDLQNETIYFIFSFSSKEEEQDIYEFMQEKWQRTIFAPLSTDMFSCFDDAEKKTYKGLLTALKGGEKNV